MSREIKFRAWDGSTAMSGEPMGFSYLDLRNDNENDFVRFLTENVEQYTGLKDKNGKEIYEGDIVKYGDSVAIIIWREKNAEFGVRWLDCGVEDSISWQIGIEKTPSEVIGNIHENPKLLGDKNVANKEGVE